VKRGERAWMKEGVETDWSFATPDILDMIHDRIRLRCAPYEMADPDDMEQNFLLFLAINPERASRIAYIKRSVDRFVQREMDHFHRDNRETSYEAMFENQED